MKRVLNRILINVLLTAMVGSVVFAGNPKRIGTAGAQELLLPVGARGMALSGSNAANTTGPEALYWNPAGLAHMTGGAEALFSQMSYIADIGVSYGAINVNAGSLGNVGFAIKSLSFGDIQNTTEDFPDGTGQTFSPTYLVGGISYAKMLNDRVAVGIVFNLVSEKIMSVSATGFAFDVGVQYSGLALPDLKLGIVVKNIGPNMAYDGSNLYRTATVGSALREAQYYKIEVASFELPTTMQIGLSYDLKPMESQRATLSAVFQNNNYQDDEYRFGAEYAYDETLFLRGGYAISPKAPADSYLYDYTFGAGVNLDLGGVGFSFDYAYRHVQWFTANNVVTVALKF